MGRRYVLVDDFDGKELPDTTQATTLTMDRKTWNLYLSDDNRGKLYDALNPFTKDAETVDSPRAASVSTGAARKHDKERIRAIRSWAKENKVLYRGDPLGDRGRIPKEIVDKYETAHA